MRCEGLRAKHTRAHSICMEMASGKNRKSVSCSGGEHVFTIYSHRDCLRISASNGTDRYVVHVSHKMWRLHAKTCFPYAFCMEQQAFPMQKQAIPMQKHTFPIQKQFPYTKSYVAYAKAWFPYADAFISYAKTCIPYACIIWQRVAMGSAPTLRKETVWIHCVGIVDGLHALACACPPVCGPGKLRS